MVIDVAFETSATTPGGWIIFVSFETSATTLKIEYNAEKCEDAAKGRLSWKGWIRVPRFAEDHICVL